MDKIRRCNDFKIERESKNEGFSTSIILQVLILTSSGLLTIAGFAIIYFSHITEFEMKAMSKPAIVIEIEPNETFYFNMVQTTDFPKIRSKRETTSMRLKEEVSEELTNLIQDPGCKEFCMKLLEKLMGISDNVDNSIAQLKNMKNEIRRISSTCKKVVAVNEQGEHDLNELFLSYKPDQEFIEHHVFRKSIIPSNPLDQDLAGSVNAKQNHNFYHIPPTGPDAGFVESIRDVGPGEIIQTSQQMEVSLPQQVQPVCFLASGPSGRLTYICEPNKGFVNSRDVTEIPRGAVRVPEVHIPTALATPNPFVFPTLSGSPVIAPVTAVGSNQVLPVFNPMTGRVSFQNYQQNYQGSINGKLQNQLPLQNQQIFLPPVMMPSQQFIVSPQTEYRPQQSFVPQINQQQNQVSPLILPMQYQQSLPIFQQQPPQQDMSSLFLPTMYQPPITPQIIIPQAQPIQSQNSASGVPNQMLQCSYVVVPNTPVQTFQFPIVPGVSETIRRSDPQEKPTGKETETHGKNITLAKALSNDRGCAPGTRPCDDQLTCVNKLSWCDSNIDCLDSSDEIHCTCKDRIMQEKLCDGYFDCPKGEDELECYGCSKNRFSCNFVPTYFKPVCLSLDRRCDGIRDCPNGKDEMDCLLISEEYQAHQVPAVSYSRGFLYRNWKGSWYHVCGTFSWQFEACAAELGHLRNYPHESYIPLPDHPNLLISQTELGVQLAHFCPGAEGTALWIQCPLPECGINPLSTRRTKRESPSLQNWINPDTYNEEFQPKTAPAPEFIKNFFNSISVFDNKKYYKRLWGHLTQPYLGVKGLNEDKLYSPNNLTEKAWKYNNQAPYPLFYPQYQSNDPYSEEPIYPTNPHKFNDCANSPSYSGGIYQNDSPQTYGEDTREYSNHINEYISQFDLPQYYGNRYIYDTVRETNGKADMENQPSNIYERHQKPTLLYDIYNDNRTKRNEEGRVVGGRISEPGTWPWIIVIYQDGAFHCGGTILKEDIILTAAHCFDDFQEHYYEVHAGILRRLSFSPQLQIRKVTEIIIHSGYDRSNMRNDIALLKLSSELKFNRWVLPACLPQPNPNLPPPGSICTAIGWGAVYEHGPDPDYLKEVKVPIWRSCNHIVDRLGNEICAGYPEGGKDTCQGDSGGPLLCRSIENKWYVGGIVSHGEGCGKKGEPGVYTRVSIFHNWILQNLGWPKRASKLIQKKCPGFVCSNEMCLPSESKCNKHIDCVDGKDEENCEIFIRVMNTTLPYYYTEVYNLLSEPSTDNISIIRSSDSLEHSKVKLEAHVSELSSVYDDSSPTVPYNSAETNTFAEVSTSEFTYETTEEGTSIFTSETTEETSLPVSIDEIFDTTKSDDIDSDTELHSNQHRSVDFSEVRDCKMVEQQIMASRWCDDYVDCEDGSDESDCSCADRLLHLSRELLCNEIIDCLDGSDEKECREMCSSGEFYCPRSNKCIPDEQRCDRKKHCFLGEDEQNCYALIGDKFTLGPDGRPPLKIKGTAVVFQNGTWTSVCEDKNPSATALTICGSIGFRNTQEIRETLVYEFPNSVDTSTKCEGLMVTCSTPFDLVWLAPVFNNGSPLILGTLISPEWIMAPLSSLSLNDSTLHLSCWLGKSTLNLDIKGPYDQYIRIDGIVQNFELEMTLFHLEEPANITHFTVPLSLPDWPTPADEKEKCDFVIMNEESKIFHIPLRPIICSPYYRCYYWETNLPFCGARGIIYCKSNFGSYISSLISKDFCKSNTVKLPDITQQAEYIKNYLNGKEIFDHHLVGDSCNGIRCENGVCIEWSRIGDGVSDCFDSRDEDDVVLKRKEILCQTNENLCSCKPGYIRCHNGECINITMFCDGKENCEDGSDEADCSCVGYLQLTRPYALCDGNQNCIDKSDEDWDLCRKYSYCNSENKFQCPSSDVCIPRDFVCDGDPDCPEHKDEDICIALRSPVDRPQEGLLFSQIFGQLVPQCLLPNDNLGKAICAMHGLQLKMSYYSQTPKMFVMTDAFSKVNLNNNTSFGLRTDRTFSKVVKFEDEICLVMYVHCQ